MKLIFVYNADAGTVNTMFDIAHKIISPETYECGLCKLTHSALSEQKAWKRFREESDIPMDFLHRDEFIKKYDFEVELPVVLLLTDSLNIALSTQEINACNTVQELIVKVKDLHL